MRVHGDKCRLWPGIHWSRGEKGWTLQLWGPIRASKASKGHKGACRGRHLLQKSYAQLRAGPGTTRPQALWESCPQGHTLCSTIPGCQESLSANSSQPRLPHKTISPSTISRDAGPTLPWIANPSRQRKERELQPAKGQQAMKGVNCNIRPMNLRL